MARSRPADPPARTLQAVYRSDIVAETQRDDGSLELEGLGPLGERLAAALPESPGGGSSSGLPDTKLVAEWDFSEPLTVDADNQIVYPIALGGAALKTLDTVTKDALRDLAIGAPVTTEWPNVQRINGLTCFVLPDPNAGPQTLFAGDAPPMVGYPDHFVLAQLSSVADGLALFADSNAAFEAVGVHDTGAELVWAAWFFTAVTNETLIRTTSVVADTDPHVVSLAYRGADTAGLYIDGTLHAWAEVDPANWDDANLPRHTAADIWLGTDNSTFSLTPAAAAIGEARVYNLLTAAEHVAVAQALATKWGTV